MAKKTGKEVRLPSNIKSLVLALVTLLSWIIAGFYIVFAVLMLSTNGGGLSLIPFITALFIVIIGSVIKSLVKKYL